jgi:DNA-directed RNA polymerase specialized sigma24 family protein
MRFFMSPESPLASNREFATPLLPAVNEQNQNYNRARLRNLYTGRLQEIILEDFTRPRREQAEDPKIELRIDVRRALHKFSPIERRVLLKVLVQGQSIEEATRRMKHSARKWRDWYSKAALPQLRAALADYREKSGVLQRLKLVA